MVVSRTQSLPRNFSTWPISVVTQTLMPSQAIQLGSYPAGKVPRTTPSLARIFVTVLTNKFVVQILAPSKAIPIGPGPTGMFWTEIEAGDSATCPEEAEAVEIGRASCRERV